MIGLSGAVSVTHPRFVAADLHDPVCAFRVAIGLIEARSMLQERFQFFAMTAADQPPYGWKRRTTGSAQGVAHLSRQVAPGTGVGARTGSTGLVVLSAAPGADLPPQIKLPQTVESLSRDGCRRLWMRSDLPVPSAAIAPGIQVIGMGGYCRLPPSGGASWVQTVDDDAIDFALTPPALVDLAIKASAAMVNPTPTVRRFH